jgi:hypothetical protein
MLFCGDFMGLFGLGLSGWLTGKIDWKWLKKFTGSGWKN